MGQPHGLPAEVQERMRKLCGRTLGTETLIGMSTSHVYRVHGERASIVLKMSPRPQEATFYTQVADRLRYSGIPLPLLLDTLCLNDGHWLLLEEIPLPLPRLPNDPVQPDDRVVAILMRLHATTRGWTPALPALPTVSWTEQVTATALSCFSPSIAAELAPALYLMQSRANELSERWCWISGDPNPTNWGMRPDGSAVLFDWERFRPGTPATDLAITIAGLGDDQQYGVLANRYLAQWRTTIGEQPWAPATLARQIALAKVATVVDFLAMHSEGKVRPREGLIPWLLDAVPPWLSRLFGTVCRPQ